MISNDRFQVHVRPYKTGESTWWKVRIMDAHKAAANINIYSGYATRHQALAAARERIAAVTATDASWELV